MSVNEGDLRVRRTRAMLRNALISLVSEVGYEAVSVRVLTERAMINRTTFYAHYDDKYDLLLEVVGTVFHTMREHPALAGDEQPWGPGQEAPRWLVDFLADLADNIAFYRGVLGVGGSERLRADLRTYLAGLIEQRIARVGTPPADQRVPAHIVAMIVASAALGSLTDWLERDDREPPEQAIAWYLETITRGAVHALGLSEAPGTHPDAP